MRSILIWPPFNEPSMPPLGIASLVGYLISRGYSAQPMDLNVALYGGLKEYFHDQPHKIVSAFNSWTVNANYQTAAAALAFPDHVRVPGNAAREQRGMYFMLKRCLEAAVENIQSDYDLAGISVTNVGFMTAAALSRLIKAAAPEMPIVWGGPTVRPGSYLDELKKHYWVDYFVDGRGEEALVQILNDLKKEQGGNNDKSGIIFSEKIEPLGGETNAVIDSGSPEKLNNTSPPDFSGFPLKSYDRLTFPLQTARGCPWSQCAFCSEPEIHQGYDPKDLESVQADVAHVMSSSRTGSIFFVDSCFNADRKRLESICTTLENNGTKNWTCMVRSEKLSFDILKQMKRAGCRRIFIGLESFSDAVLKAMQKGCSKLDQLKAFRLAQETGIRIEANFMIGFPGETAVDIRENIRVLKRFPHLWNKSNFWISPFSVTPGSRIYRDPQEYGISFAKADDIWSGLPKTISDRLPIWNHSWSNLDEKPALEMEKLKLYSRLEDELTDIQRGNLPEIYLENGPGGSQICRKDRRTGQRTPKRLSKMQAKLLTACREITNLHKLTKQFKVRTYKVKTVLIQMQELGWLAKSGSRYVTTVPIRKPRA